MLKINRKYKVFINSSRYDVCRLVGIREINGFTKYFFEFISSSTTSKVWNYLTTHPGFYGKIVGKFAKSVECKCELIED